MATVRDATDRRLGRPVAVKILRADLAEQPRARERFETEAHAAARLAHPNVVMVFDSGEDDGSPFLVMERLSGRTFADELAEGPVAVGRICDIGGEILAALAAAHAAGIIHRDIKPANVLLTDDGHAKVSDFGIAKTLDDGDQTQTAEVLATPGYLAPERLAGRPASERSDLYSVGVLLYEALGRRRPFSGDTPLALMHAIERGEAEPLMSLRPELPPAVVAVVERAMHVDPAERFGSASEMAAALDPSADLDATVAIGAIGAAGATPTVLLDRGADAGNTRALPVAAPVETAVGRSDNNRARKRAFAVAVLTALAVGIIGIVATRHDSTRPIVPATSISTTPPTTALTRATRVTSPPATTPTTAVPGKPQPPGENTHRGKGKGDNGDKGG
jgi:serine/threonine-protein kinase